MRAFTHAAAEKRESLCREFYRVIEECIKMFFVLKFSNGAWQGQRSGKNEISDAIVER